MDHILAVLILQPSATMANICLALVNTVVFNTLDFSLGGR